MKKRIVEEFRIGEEVEIDFGEGPWLRVVVVKHAHPGLWVQDEMGRQWFVTNKKRIRRWQDAA
jgi:hypothetical protein